MHRTSDSKLQVTINAQGYQPPTNNRDIAV